MEAAHRSYSDPVTSSHTFDALILGGGAAGLMCAIQAAKGGQRVAVLDHAGRIGKKILISGGGRCNFTNLHCKPENFLSANPHFAKSALARYTPGDFIALVEKHKIEYHEKTLGQLFCDRSAQQIVTLLEEECAKAGVTIFLNARIQKVSHNLGFHISTRNAEFSAPALVVATGGLSIPKMGATSLGYDIATQFGIHLQPCRPALVPLTLNAEDRDRYCDLAGVSMEVIAACGRQRFREKMLITHRGLSGPAILQISSYWKPPAPLLLDLAPEKTWTTPLLDPLTRRDLAAVRSALRGIFPQRLADRWVHLHPPAAFTNHALSEMERQTHRWQVTPAGTEDYEKAEATAGGVDTAELSAKTMECKKVRGLFFIGEVVDVTGHLGGFNFQWAWASGYSAGLSLAQHAISV